MNPLFGVWFCGSTDCFLHAVFADKAEAETWMRSHSLYTEEGDETPFVREVTDEELKQMRDPS